MKTDLKDQRVIVKRRRSAGSWDLSSANVLPIINNAALEPNGTYFEVEFTIPGLAPILPSSAATGFEFKNTLGTTYTITSTSRPDSITIRFALSLTISDPDLVFYLNYVPGNVQDSAGNLLAAVSNFPVTNTIPPP